MSSLPPDRPQAPPPFPAPGVPPGIPPPSARPSGCWRVGLVGCGIAGLALLLVIVGAILYVRRNPAAVADFAMSQVESHFAADVTDQDKADLRAAYAAYRERLRSGKASPEPLQRVKTVFLSGDKNNEITREQVHELTAAFREGANPASGPGEAPLRGPYATPSPGALTPSPRGKAQAQPQAQTPSGTRKPVGVSPEASPAARVP